MDVPLDKSPGSDRPARTFCKLDLTALSTSDLSCSRLACLRSSRLQHGAVGAPTTPISRRYISVKSVVACFLVASSSLDFASLLVASKSDGLKTVKETSTFAKACSGDLIAKSLLAGDATLPPLLCSLNPLKLAPWLTAGSGEVLALLATIIWCFVSLYFLSGSCLQHWLGGIVRRAYNQSEG